jgi:branched-chain amino acid transport system substrate-binding protein
MPVRRLLLAGPAIALLLAVPVACTGDDDAAPTTDTDALTTSTTEPARADDDVLRIGMLVPLSGEGATIGQAMAAAAERAVEEINRSGGVLGARVELVQADEGSDGSSASDGISALLDEGVDAVVGPTSSTVALATLDDLLAAGVLTCSPTATSLALDDFPSSDLFFRTAPSDSLQADAIGRLAQQTGLSNAAVVFLDDRYGHPLADAVVNALQLRALEVVTQVPFASNDETLVDEATELVESEAEVVVLLGDAEHALRMLTAMGETLGTSPDVDPPEIIVNDAVRRPPSPQLVQALPAALRERIQGVSPVAEPLFDAEPPGPFATNAYDCINLIALSAFNASDDDPNDIAVRMVEMSSSGQPCGDYQECADLLAAERNIDYDGPGGEVQLGGNGDPDRARFDVFEFDADGRDVSTRTLFP